MGYQALLFCPDEKLARVVSQVFNELEFSVEPVHEPFAAVKKLMAQRFDAVVVDCENEQSASLLFKSARNSSFNQSSLAIALVEGQAGVAKAYRIGANLVLTKPVNVDQAKGTLRVARGLLRKNSEAAGSVNSAPSAMPAPSAPATTTASFQALIQGAAAIAAGPSITELPEIQTPPAAIPEVLPAAAASAIVAEKPIAVPAPVSQAPIPAVPETLKADPLNNEQVNNQPVNNAPPAEPAPAHKASFAFTPVSASAAAPAPAKEAVAAPPPESKTVELEPVIPSQNALPASVPASDQAGISESPSFATLSDEDSNGSGGNKKILIAAAAILALAVLGYFGYQTFAGSAHPAPAAQPVQSPQNSGQSAPAPAPITSPQPAPSITTAGPASSVQSAPSKPLSSALPAASSTSASDRPVTRLSVDAAPNSAPEAKPLASAPIVVRSNTAHAQADESAPAPPSPDSVASAGGSMTGLISSASPNLPKLSASTLKISQGVSQGLLIKRVQPIYPAAALAVHAHGTVQIEATINKEGIVTNPKVTSGDAILGRAALAAVRQWRYKPYYLDREPVEIETQITINFKAN